ncbi:MAG: ArsR family transcriptional regulator [Magnetococcales bacterium]|nr:ArsR family transcriptional regulator [Magnetococcales bacterium]
MAKSFKTLLAENRRLFCLLALETLPEYRAPATLLQDYLRGRGVGCGLVEVIEEMHWLEDGGLLTVEPGETIPTATLTRSGLDVVRGLTLHPGVARPEPTLQEVVVRGGIEVAKAHLGVG